MERQGRERRRLYFITILARGWDLKRRRRRGTRRGGGSGGGGGDGAEGEMRW